MRLAVGVIRVALLASAALTQLGPSPTTLANTGTPEAPPVIASEVLGQAAPVSVENPELAIARVTIMPGAVIPVHRHPGTQIGLIVQGTLTYTVFTGAVEWRRAAEQETDLTLIEQGQTVHVLAGDTLIENPDSIHQGRNDGDVPVVIYLSTLFPEGSPRSIIVEATPTS